MLERQLVGHVWVYPYLLAPQIFHNNSVLQYLYTYKRDFKFRWVNLRKLKIQSEFSGK